MFGLTLSLTFVILIADYSYRLLSTDSYHKNNDNIYLLSLDLGMGKAIGGMYSMGPNFCNKFPNIDDFCSVFNFTNNVKYKELELKKENIMEVDSSFFKLFSFDLLEGDKKSALNSPDKCIITESSAKKIFGAKQSLGESIIIGDKSYTISGVIKDFERTVINNKAAIIRLCTRSVAENMISLGGPGTLKMFYLTNKGTDIKLLEEEIKVIVPDFIENISLIPLRKVLFHPSNDNCGLETGNKDIMRILIYVALAILIFAVLNYINLSIAQVGFRAKEMASRKLLGASKKEISLRMIFESLFIVSISFILAFILALSLEKDMMNLFEGEINLLGDLNLSIILVCLAFILALSIITGFIPALYISKYKAIDVVNGNFRFRSKMHLTKIFISLQNIISIVLIVSCLIINKQIRHLIDAPLGFNTDDIFVIHINGGKADVIKNELEKIPHIEKIGIGTISPANGYGMSVLFKKDDKIQSLSNLKCDQNYIDLYGIEFLHKNNVNSKVYLNEKALEVLELNKDSKSFNIYNSEASQSEKDDNTELLAGVTKNIKIGGVMQDINMLRTYIYNTAEELFKNDPKLIDNYSTSIHIKVNGPKDQVLKDIRKICEKNIRYYNEQTSEDLLYSVNDKIASKFNQEKKVLTLVSVFTVIAIIISLLGFIAMGSYLIQQRRKEVAIRKIMGSTSTEVLIYLLKKFITPLLISFIIAIPLAYYIMSRWLENYTWRVSQGAWIYIAAGIFSIGILLLSILWQSIRVARSNPSESIKLE